jgi:hypothetical protein
MLVIRILSQLMRLFPSMRDPQVPQGPDANHSARARGEETPTVGATLDSALEAETEATEVVNVVMALRTMMYSEETEVVLVVETEVDREAVKEAVREAAREVAKELEVPVMAEIDLSQLVAAPDTITLMRADPRAEADTKRIFKMTILVRTTKDAVV